MSSDDRQPGPVFDEADAAEANLEAEVKFLREAYHDLREEVVELRATVERDGQLSGGRHQLESLAQLDPTERQSVLGDDADSKLRAVRLYEHWDSVAWSLGTDGGRYGVDTNTKSTKKHQPAKIKVELRKLLDEDLQWNQIYRLMKAFATLSGGTHHVDEYSREHVHGGEWKYHEKPTADGKDTKRVLYRDGRRSE